MAILSKGWMTFKFNPLQYLNWRDSSWVRLESASKLIILENENETKLIDVKVLGRLHFKSLNKETPKSPKVIEESCDSCDWIIFAKYFENSTFWEL